MSRRSAPAVERPPHQYFDVVVQPSLIDGHGVFAAEYIPPRALIGELRGEPVSVAEGRRRAAGRRRIMLVELSPDEAVDASRSTDPLRFTNHACQPNAHIVIAGGRIEFHALRAIAPGEELTVDYGVTHHGGQLRCRCGAPGCQRML